MKAKKIVLAVCGSVAAIETPKLARELRRRGVVVECVMSESAKKIINPNVLEWATERGVITEITGRTEHVRLCGVGGEADLLLICPATSNTISKIACGIDDTSVTTFAATAIGSGKKVIIAPAMHCSMYKNPFVEENIKKLEKNGITIIEPRFEENKAKVATNEEIVEKVLRELKTK
jgi:phosphopantothenoylcysteine decarboxylase / phosphopantothenate---cysteine ligase